MGDFVKFRQKPNVFVRTVLFVISSVFIISLVFRKKWNQSLHMSIHIIQVDRY